MKKLFTLLLGIALFTTANAQVTVSGVDVPGKAKFGQDELTLNGAGTRSKWMMSLYVGSLFMEEKSSDAQAIIDKDAPMAIRLNIISGMITSEKMIGAMDEGFENSTKGNPEPLSAEIKQFKSVFSAVDKGDKYEFFYEPGAGTHIFKNGSKSTTVKGMEFKKALFGIWFCDKPADKDLKSEMLGK